MDRRDFTRGLAGTVGALSLGGAVAATPFARVLRRDHGIDPSLRLNGERINKQLMELAEFGKNPYGGVSRVAYSDADKQGREYVTGLMRQAQLDVSIDAGGNILGRRAGSDPSKKVLLFGSHIDSVPDGGNYDGDVGVLSSIEIARTLAERQITTRHPIEVVVFQNEEGGTVGSRAMIGHVTEKDFDLVTKSGKTIRDGITYLGGDISRLNAPLRQRGDVAAYVELHIEQGGTLEAQKLNIGIVEGIVGIGWWDVTVEGFANHAGTTAMGNRRDAMLAAARYVDMVNRVVTSEPGRQVGTVGRMQPIPGATNVIPGKVLTSLEIRDLDKAKIVRLYERVRREAQQIGEATGTTFTFTETYLSTPALMDGDVQQAIASSTAALGLTNRMMPSGAGHDAQEMAQLAPAGMIFCPSVGGISHSPKEYTKPEDVVNGANVLLHTILHLDAM